MGAAGLLLQRVMRAGRSLLPRIGRAPFGLLPRCRDAVVPRAKLTNYLLSTEHRRGRDKLVLFQATLGIGPGDEAFLTEQLIAGVRQMPYTGTRLTFGGINYEVIMPIRGRNGATVLVVTAWHVPNDGGAPWFVTAYPDRP
jgi:hypothetical protein